MKQDKIVRGLIQDETKRQARVINLIASENYVSPEVRNALGSVFTNKYAEGYPKARYYGGNSVVDAVEQLAQTRALELFDLDTKEWSVNVQPYSGSPANLAVYTALVPAGEKIMGLELNMGGHLTHGHSVSATGKFWKQVGYGVDQKTGLLDYDVLEVLARRERPKLIVAGYTAYSRIIDFKKFRHIADALGAIFMVDMSHFAGLVAGKVYPSPFEYADIVTTTTHKTLRGPRGAVIFSRAKHTRDIDRAVFPGLQGGPHVNQIAAAAVTFAEASTPQFRKYAAQIVKNAKALAWGLSQSWGLPVISGGTDTHLFLLNTYATCAVSGKEASELLERADIIVNKNAIPYDERKPFDPSGIRIGTPAITTRGMCESDMSRIAEFIGRVLAQKQQPATVKKEVAAFTRKFPVP